MRFHELLRTAVLLCAGAASMLGALTVAVALGQDEQEVLAVAVAWWTAAAAFGTYLGRDAATTTAVGRLLADARAQSSLPPQEPARVLLNRLWPLGVSALAAGGAAFVLPQAAAVAAGFCLLGALAWRRQPGAVEAVEGRDGVRFYVGDASPVQPIKLVRTPGLRSVELNGTGRDAVPD